MGEAGVSFIVASPHLPTIAAAVRGILAQQAAPSIVEILVAGASNEPLPASDLVRVLEIPPGPAYAAYNTGLAAARGEVVALVDGDCVLAPDWLTRVLWRHAEGWDVVAGGIRVPKGGYWATTYNYAGLSEWLASRPSGPRRVLPTLNLSVRRSVAERTGPVRSDLPRVYDYDWTLRMSRLGFRLFFDAAARASHSPPGVTPRVLWRTWFANGSCSQAVRRQNRDLIAYPRLLEHAALMRLLSPGLAAASTLRVVARDPLDARLWSVAPAVWFTRMAWFVGASAGRARGPLSVAEYRYQTHPVGRRGFWHES